MSSCLPVHTQSVLQYTNSQLIFSKIALLFIQDMDGSQIDFNKWWVAQGLQQKLHLGNPVVLDGACDSLLSNKLAWKPAIPTIVPTWQHFQIELSF